MQVVAGNPPKTWSWAAVGLLLVIGTIHAVDAPDCFEEAAYKGWLFYANGLGSLVAAYGIVRDKSFGWPLGFVIAAGSFVGYVASRTVGLPLIPAEPDAWLEPLGIGSLIAEALFVAIFLAAAQRRKQAVASVPGRAAGHSA